MKRYLLAFVTGGLLASGVMHGCDDADATNCPPTGGNGQGGEGAIGGSGGTGGSGGSLQEVPFEEAEVKIEINDTDGDSGLHFFVDAAGWEWVDVYDPSDTLIFHVEGRSSVRQTGLTELFFESAEPGFAVLPLADFLERFPEGTYRLEGRSTVGDRMVGEATLTHALPDAPVLVSPASGSMQDPSNTVVEWQPVADPPGSSIVRYEVIVAQEIPPPTRELSMHLPASVTSVTVPTAFLLPGQQYKYEVIAVEESGNQTLSEAPFQTMP